MVTMHDVMDAQWWLDNMRDGEKLFFVWCLTCIFASQRSTCDMS